MHEQFSNAFYSSDAWQRCRRAYRSMRGGLCERCLASGLITPGTQVHHKKPITPENLSDPSVTLDFSNLMLLCDSCHKKIHRELDAGARRWLVDDDGKIISRENF